MIRITDTGAQPGRVCTDAIQSAIDQAGEAGGTVFIPAGTFLTGTLKLRSGVKLNLHPAAVLKAANDIDLFPPSARAERSEHSKRNMIFADGCENIEISGGGTLDGSGPAFWNAPAEGSNWYRAKNPRVSPMLELRRCKHVVLDNVNIVDSPGWTVHPFCCDHVIIRNITIKNHLHGPNTDGIDVNGCRDVFITGCRLTCGDDGIIIKATKDARTCERITVSDCVINTNCIGVGLGQETESGIRQVTVSNCVMFNSHRMFAAGIWAGGWIEDVTVTGCVGDTLNTYPLARPIQLEVKQHVGWDVPLGHMKNVQISNFISKGAGRILLTAQDGTMLENVSLRDIRMDFTELEDAEKLSPPTGDKGSSQYANRNLEARRQNAAVVVENASKFTLDGLNVTWPDNGDVPYSAVWARNVQGGQVNIPLADGCNGAEPARLENVDWIER
ncbi:MAG: glycoside hydrolase family 28 protein [Phycisphaerae bacterium]